MKIKELRFCSDLLRSADKYRRLKSECRKLESELRRQNKAPIAIYGLLIDNYASLKARLETSLEPLSEHPDLCPEGKHNWTTNGWQNFSHRLGSAKITEWFKRCGDCDFKLSTFNKPEEIRLLEEQEKIGYTLENNPQDVVYLEKEIQKSLKIM